MLFEMQLEQDGEMTRVQCHAVVRDDILWKLIGDAQGKPEHWASLEWHYIAQSPCLWGDNTFAAAEPDLSIGYIIFDGWCAEHRLADAKHKWTNAQEFFVLDAKVGCGHIDVEDLG